jgi:hypothetical protein
MRWSDAKHKKHSANSNSSTNPNRSGARTIKLGPRQIEIGTKRVGSDKDRAKHIESTNRIEAKIYSDEYGSCADSFGKTAFGNIAETGFCAKCMGSKQHSTECIGSEKDNRVGADKYSKQYSSKCVGSDKYSVIGLKIYSYDYGVWADTFAKCIESKQYSNECIGAGKDTYRYKCIGFGIDSDAGSGSDSDDFIGFKNYSDEASSWQGTIEKIEAMAKWIGSEQYITEYIPKCIGSGIDIDIGSKIDSNEFIGFANNSDEVSSWHGTIEKFEFVAKGIGSDPYSTECICADKNSDERVGSNRHDDEYSSQELSDRAEAVTGECRVRENRISEWFERSPSSKKLYSNEGDSWAVGVGVRNTNVRPRCGDYSKGVGDRAEAAIGEQSKARLVREGLVGDWVVESMGVNALTTRGSDGRVDRTIVGRRGGGRRVEWKNLGIIVGSQDSD